MENCNIPNIDIIVLSVPHLEKIQYLIGRKGFCLYDIWKMFLQRAIFFVHIRDRKKMFLSIFHMNNVST